MNVIMFLMPGVIVFLIGVLMIKSELEENR